MRAEGNLRGRFGAYTDDFQEKQSSNWKDNQGIEWNKLLFLVPELQHRNVQEKKPSLAIFFGAANDFQIRVHWCDPLGKHGFSKQINVVECIQNGILTASTGDSDVSAGPSPGSSEHCCSGASTFEGTTHHASYFNSM